MKKILIALVVALTLAIAAPVVAKEKMASLGLAFDMPYTISPGSGRGPVGMDLLGEYYINQNFALHLMFQFQFEGAKAMFINPGMKYYFWTEKTWTPYAQVEVLLGIKNASGTSNMNYGFRFGPGINFDLSEVTGLEGLNTFFDVDFNGLFKTTRVWSIDVFRLGFAYAF